MTTPDEPVRDDPAPDAASFADPGPGARPAPAPGEPAADASVPILPEQSPGDTDAAWGDYPDRTDDRLLQDRPPHWDDF